MRLFQLNLTLEETNLALEALGQMPFARVYQLIAKIQQQTAAQLSQENKSEDGPPDQVSMTEDRP